MSTSCWIFLYSKNITSNTLDDIDATKPDSDAVGSKACTNTKGSVTPVWSYGVHCYLGSFNESDPVVPSRGPTWGTKQTSYTSKNFHCTWFLGRISPNDSDDDGCETP